MHISLLKTDDNSNTLYNSQLNETYHSRHGALAESNLVFIQNGLNYLAQSNKQLSILEVGMGTGLNAILTYDFANQHHLQISYHAIEAFPLTIDLIKSLNYGSFLSEASNNVFNQLHDIPWDEPFQLSSHFSMLKKPIELQQFIPDKKYDLIYFDAFAPDKQPELWTLEQFSKLYQSLNDGGVLVTYSAKGEVKRNLREAGFSIERLAGPPPKRHVIRATKVISPNSTDHSVML